MKTVSFHTLGCKLNFAETSTVERQFVERGFQIVGFHEQTEICVINTCSVTQRTDKECRQIIRGALRMSPNAFVVVTGCYAQLKPEEIARIPGVDLVLGTNEKFKIFDYADGFIKNNHPSIFVSPISEIESFGPASSFDTDGRTRAFLKVQDGCDYTCSFCVIPFARGASRSEPLEVTVAQATELVRQGYKEIVLTGVNVGDYGKKYVTSIFVLLKELDKIDGICRVRISSIEPNLLKRDMIEYIAQSEKVCHHFHIPLQSGHNEILRLMQRRYTVEHYYRLIHTIKELIPDCGIGVDVIVGFPGETNAYFEETYRFIRELPIAYLHVFSYSERLDTGALNLPGSVDPKIRHERSERLRMLGAKKKYQFYSEILGKTLPVLLEREKKEGRMFGFTDNYVRVSVEYDQHLVNEIADVKLMGIADNVAVGEVMERE